MPKKKKKEVIDGPVDIHEAAVASEALASILLSGEPTFSPDTTEAAVSLRGYFSDSDESDDAINLSFSSDLTRRAMRRCFTVLKRHSRVHLLVSRAFIDRALLVRGFNELLWNNRKQKALRFRRRRLLGQSVDGWIEYVNRDMPMNSVFIKLVNGMFVWSCVRWMAVTLGTDRQVYAADSENSAIRLQGRQRAYIEAIMRISRSRNPLYVTAIAKLDAFQIKFVFNAWRKWTVRLLTMVKHCVTERIRRALLHWFRGTIRKLRLQRAMYVLVSQRSGVSIIQCFASWMTLFKASHHERCRIRPKRYYRAMTKLYRNISHEKIILVLKSRSDVFFMMRIYQKAIRQFKILGRRRRATTRSYYNVRQLLARNTLSSTFGLWIILVAKEIELGRKANRVVCKRFKAILWDSFFSWNHMYTRSSLIRHSEREKLAAYSIELNARLRTALGNKERKKRQEVLRQWSRVTRQRKGGSIVYILLETSFFKQLKHLAFRKWFFNTNLAIIVNCVKKHWRGFRFRVLKAAAVVKYLKWYKEKIPVYLKFYKNALKVRFFKKFVTHCHNINREYEICVQNIQLVRAFVLFQKFRSNRSRYWSRYWSVGGLAGVFGMKFRVRRGVVRLIDLSRRSRVRKAVNRYTGKFRLKYLLSQAMNTLQTRLLFKQVRQAIVDNHMLKTKVRSAFQRLREFGPWHASRRRQFFGLAFSATQYRLVNVVGRLYSRAYLRSKIRQICKRFARKKRKDVILSAWNRLKCDARLKIILNDLHGHGGGCWARYIAILKLKQALVRFRKYAISKVKHRCELRRYYQDLFGKLNKQRLLRVIQYKFRWLVWQKRSKNGLTLLTKRTRNSLLVVVHKLRAPVLQRQRRTIDMSISKSFQLHRIKRVTIKHWILRVFESQERRIKISSRLAIVNFSIAKEYFRKFCRFVGLHRRLRRIRRRFHVLPFIHIWLTKTVSCVKIRQVIQFQSIKRNRLLVSFVIRGWKRWVVHNQNLARMHGIIQMRSAKKSLLGAYNAWTRTIGILNDERMTKQISKQNVILAQKRVLRKWRRAYISSVKEKRKCTEKVFIAWKGYYRVKQEKSYQRNVLGPCHHDTFVLSRGMHVFVQRLEACSKNHKRSLWAANQVTYSMAKILMRNWKHRIHESKRGELQVYRYFKWKFADQQELLQHIYTLRKDAYQRHRIEKKIGHLWSTTNSRRGANTINSVFETINKSYDLSPAPTTENIEDLDVSEIAPTGGRSLSNLTTTLHDVSISKQVLSKRRIGKKLDIFRETALFYCAGTIAMLKSISRYTSFWILWARSRSCRRRMKLKKCIIFAWRKAAVSWRVSRDILMGALETFGIKLRLRIYFTLLVKNRMVYKAARQIQQDKTVSMVKGALNHWKREGRYRLALAIATRVAESVAYQTGWRIITSAFVVMRTKAISSLRIMRPKVKQEAWRRLRVWYFVIKHRYRVLQRMVIGMWTRVVNGRKRKRIQRHCIRTLITVTDNWNRRMRMFYHRLGFEAFKRFMAAAINYELHNKSREHVFHDGFAEFWQDKISSFKKTAPSNNSSIRKS